jgi:hypothetical protein
MVEAKNSGYPSPSHSCFFKEAVLFTPVTDWPRTTTQRDSPKFANKRRPISWLPWSGWRGGGEENNNPSRSFFLLLSFPSKLCLGVVELWEASSHATWPPGVCTENSRERDESAVRRLQAWSVWF